MGKARKLDVHFSTGKDDWETPQDLFDEISKKHGPFDLDVCATVNNCKCRNWISEKTTYIDEVGWSTGDGLTQSWWVISDSMNPEFPKCWMNPPYSRGQQAKWIRKAYEESQKGCTVVALLPARTDTRAFHDYIWDRDLAAPKAGVQVEFLKGRVKFVGAAHGAPFPSMVVVFNPPQGGTK